MVSKGSLASRTETDSFRANITVASRLASILRNIRLHLQQTIHWQKYAQQTAFSGIKVDNDIGRQAEGTFCSLALHMSCLEKFYFSSVWAEEDLMPIEEEEEEEKGGETHAARRGALSSARKEADKWRRSTILFFTLLDS